MHFKMNLAKNFLKTIIGEKRHHKGQQGLVMVECKKAPWVDPYP